MFKPLLAAVAASPFIATSAFAGPYVNVESNVSYPDGEYSGATTDIHIGYEGTRGKLGYYIQGGPALVAVDGTDGSEGEISGKIGASYAATETLGVYGELSLITTEVNNDDQKNWGAKIGAKFNF